MAHEQRDSARATTGWVVALVLWVCVIWGNSLISGPASDANSYAVVGVLRDLFGFFGITDPEFMNHIVRKGAHFCEYAVSGFLVCRALGVRPGEGLASHGRAVALGVAIAALDECIQLFVPNRAGMVEDVLLDTCGVCFGVLMAHLVARLRRH